jgi:hypothetical protein
MRWLSSACYLYTRYMPFRVRPLAKGIEEQSSLRSFVQSRCAWRIQIRAAKSFSSSSQLCMQRTTIPWWWRQRGPLKRWTAVKFWRGWSPEKILLNLRAVLTIAHKTIFCKQHDRNGCWWPTKTWSDAAVFKSFKLMYNSEFNLHKGWT